MRFRDKLETDDVRVMMRGFGDKLRDKLHGIVKSHNKSTSFTSSSSSFPPSPPRHRTPPPEKVERELARATDVESLPTDIRHCTELLLRLYKDEQELFSLRDAEEPDVEVHKRRLRKEANELWAEIRGMVGLWVGMEGTEEGPHQWTAEESAAVLAIQQMVLHQQQASRF